MAALQNAPPGTHIVELASDFSDGSDGYWPHNTDYERRPDDFYYHKSLALQWMQSTGQAQPGKQYMLEALPSGYSIYIKARKNGKNFDRYLFGHPRGRFDSPIKFFVHYKYLMSGGKGECDCVNCKSIKAAQKPGVDKSSFKKRTLASRTDARETNDAQKYIDLLYRKSAENNSTTLEFTHGNPPGWEYCLFNPYIEYKPAYLEAHSFEPREDEIVLLYEEPLGLRLDGKRQYMQMFSDESQSLQGWPKWKAGRVVSTPEAGVICLRDLAWPKDKQDDHTKTFCIEILPSDERECSSPRRVNLPINHIRPFSMLRELHNGKIQDDWEKKIIQTASIMSNLCLIEPCAFMRLFPNVDSSAKGGSKSLDAKFRCRQILIGGERISQGDAIRLMPNKDESVIHSILLIEEIAYVYEHLETMSPTTSIYLEGRCFTTTQPQNQPRPVVQRDATYEELSSHNLPTCMRGYTWYEAGAVTRVSPESIVGRCYEREAMELLIYSADLNVGLDGVRHTREWAMAKGHGSWVWGARKEGDVRLNDLKIGRERALECGQALPNGAKTPHVDFTAEEKNNNETHGDTESLNGTLSRMEMSIDTGSEIEGKQGEADAFISQVLEGSFGNDSEEEHAAKRPKLSLPSTE